MSHTSSATREGTSDGGDKDCSRGCVLVRFLVSEGYKYAKSRERSVQKGDVRAVENPITAVFDLAEDVEARSPKIRVSIVYARIFIAFGLLLDAVMILLVSGKPGLSFLLTFLMFFLLYVRRWLPDATSRSVVLALAFLAGVFDVISFGPVIIFGLILVPFFFLGLVAMEYLREVHSFFEYYALRHRIVKSVRDADPVAYVPAGSDSTQRVLAFLASRNPAIGQLMKTPGGAVAPAILQGKSGMMYRFDVVVQRAPTGLRGLLGFGSPGSAIYVKSFTAPPNLSDLQAIKRAVEDISIGTRVPPWRVIAVWKADGDAKLSDEAYEYVTKEVVRVTFFGVEHTCSLQSIEENPDGTYDFIPFIPEIAALGPQTSPAAA